MKRRNSINGRFAARLIEMLKSPAYRVLSRAAHMVLARVELELGYHGGNDAARLPVTNSDFVDYGVHRAAIAPAIRELEALGFIVSPSVVAAVTPSIGRRMVLSHLRVASRQRAADERLAPHHDDGTSTMDCR